MPEAAADGCFRHAMLADSAMPPLMLRCRLMLPPLPADAAATLPLMP